MQHARGPGTAVTAPPRLAATAAQRCSMAEQSLYTCRLRMAPTVQSSIEIFASFQCCTSSFLS